MCEIANREIIDDMSPTHCITQRIDDSTQNKIILCIDLPQFKQKLLIYIMKFASRESKAHEQNYTPSASPA